MVPARPAPTRPAPSAGAAQAAHVVQQEQHLGFREAPPQALSRAKAEVQVREPGAGASVVQPALGMIALRAGEHSRVSAQAIELHVDQRLQTGAEGWSAAGQGRANRVGAGRRGCGAALTPAGMW